MKYFSIRTHLLWISFVYLSLSAESYTARMTSNEYHSYFTAYIAEFDSKRCYIRPGYDDKACQRYCQYIYQYVPTLPFKNAQRYNPTTKLCEPQFFCPKIIFVRRDEEKNNCVDSLLNINIPPIDAPIPTYQDSQLFDVTVICQNGKVITFNGRQDCQCQLGFGSLPTPSLSSKRSFKKCTQPIPIAAYFPNFMKIYYDAAYDNLFPFAALPDYWIRLMLYYLRNLKYSITSFFVPYEVQLITVTIPLQPTFQPSDWIWFVWILIFLFILFVITMFEKCVQKLKQVAQQEQA